MRIHLNFFSNKELNNVFFINFFFKKKFINDWVKFESTKWG